MNQDDKARLEALKSADVFDVMERMTDGQIKASYWTFVKFGPQSVGHEHTDRTLDMLVYELNRRENRKTFSQMRWLTCIAIGLSVVQLLVGLASMCNK